jgi:hypothetical protein
MRDKKQFLMATSFLLVSSLFPVQADVQGQARKLYLSLTGTTPSSTEVDLITQKITAGKSFEVAKDIIDSKNGMDSKGNFYNVTVKNFATPWSNVDYTKMFPLNDLSATVIGWVRDEKQFNQILYSDSVYTANGIPMSGTIVGTEINNSSSLIYTASTTTDCGGVPKCTTCNDPAVKKGRILFLDPSTPNSTQKLCRFTVLTEAEFKTGRSNNHYYIPQSDTKLSTALIKTANTMYEEMESNNLNLGDPKVLTEKSQTVRLHQDPNAISGIMTTRAWGFANYTAGTNRRAFQSTMKHMFCKDMMSFNDTNTPDFRVRQDVDRNVGGNASTFKTLCVGCHSGMDAQGGAYAYYSFPSGAIEYKQGVVVSKMTHNKIYTPGFITQDDSWMNLSNQGQNASFGWGPQESGNGLNSLAQMYSETKEFHRCMAKTVFKTVCFREANTPKEIEIVKALSSSYEEDNFNMKNLFLRTSIACMGN